MKLTIDNFDSFGARDYSAALDAEHPPRVSRRLNRPAELRAWLLASDAQFVVPARGARLLLARNDGAKIFTGYVTSAPDYEYLGWGERGPVYRYALCATGDESLLDQKTLPKRAPFTNRTGGDALKQLAEDLLPGGFDYTGVETLEAVPFYAVDSRKPWSQHAAALAVYCRAAYRVHDAQLSFCPVGDAEYALDEAAPQFCPEGLKLSASHRLVNDVTVVGYVEPRAYVKDYFLGDGYTLRFYLSEVPFGRGTSLLLDEEYTDPVLRPTRWAVTDPSHAVSIAGGKLRIEGAATILFAEQIELGGALQLQHGDISFTAASDGLIGGLYTGVVAPANCYAGFQNLGRGRGVADRRMHCGFTRRRHHDHGRWASLRAAHAHLRPGNSRRGQKLHSSLYPAASGPAARRMSPACTSSSEIHDIDPNNPPSVSRHPPCSSTAPARSDSAVTRC